MELKGKIKIIGETQTFGSNGFTKRECVVTVDDEKYPQHIMVEFVQDKTELLDKFAIGDAVIISINLRGREWTNPQGEVKYFNSIQGWRVVKDGDAVNSKPSAPPINQEEDDLPF